MLVSSRPPPRVGIVVTDSYPVEDPDHDTPLLVDALLRRGAEARPVVWHDDSVDLAGFDLLVLRSPWDYPERLPEFLAWLDRAEAATRVLNTPATVRWNLDKRYLEALADAGIRVVPTEYCGTAEQGLAALGRVPGRAVIKPAVSAGARDTGLFERDDPGALVLAERIVARGGIAMIQPEIPELSAGAEKALYAIDGRHAHAIAKGALLEVGGRFRGGVYIENPVLVEATAAERAFAEEVLTAVQAVSGQPMPLYARIDVVDSARFGLVLLEVELAEPALNLHVAGQVTDLVAAAVLRAVRA